MEAFFMVWFSGGLDFRVSFVQKNQCFRYKICLFSECEDENIKLPVSQEGARHMDKQKQCHQVLGRLTTPSAWQRSATSGKH